MFVHILLASDGSECALKAADVAVTLAGKFDSQLTIINVHQILPTVGPFGEVIKMDIDEECRNALQENAIQGAGRIADSHGVPYLGLKEIGLPDTEIVRVAQEKACDLIVLGSRGLNAFQSFLLGSVSDHVTHHAHCPVLIVR
jgi:nucleotide-binding universal stress UspA family protein